MTSKQVTSPPWNSRRGAQAKKWFGHCAGRSPCAHSIGKFFLCYIVLFLLETSAPGLSGHYWYNPLYNLNNQSFFHCSPGLKDLPIYPRYSMHPWGRLGNLQNTILWGKFTRFAFHRKYVTYSWNYISCVFLGGGFPQTFQSTVKSGSAVSFCVVSPVLLVSVQLFDSFEHHVQQNICLETCCLLGLALSWSVLSFALNVPNSKSFMINRQKICSL